MYSFRYADPRMTGVIVKEAVRCGKPNCRCVRGRFHRWYYYLYYRVLTVQGWKLKKEYIRKVEADALRQKIHAAKTRERRYKLQLGEMQRMLREIEQQLRLHKVSN